MVTVGSILHETFAFLRANGRSIAIWSGLVFVMSLLSTLGMRPFYAARLAAMQSGAIPAPQFGILALVGLVAVLIFIVLWAAVFRAVLFPADDRYAYLRVGMDELRLLGAMFAILVGGYIGFLLLGVLIGVVSGIVVAAAGATGGVVTGIILGFMLLGAAVWAGVRVSPCGPLTILQRKIIIGPAWRLTRGRFWQLLGAYVVTGLILLFVYAIIMVVQLGPVLGDMFRPADPEAARRVAAWQAGRYGDGVSASLLINAFVGAIVTVLALFLQAGTTAVATRELLDAGGGTAETLLATFE